MNEERKKEIYKNVQPLISLVILFLQILIFDIRNFRNMGAAVIVVGAVVGLINSQLNAKQPELN